VSFEYVNILKCIGSNHSHAQLIILIVEEKALVAPHLSVFLDITCSFCIPVYDELISCDTLTKAYLVFLLIRCTQEGK